MKAACSDSDAHVDGQTLSNSCAGNLIDTEVPSLCEVPLTYLSTLLEDVLRTAVNVTVDVVVAVANLQTNCIHDQDRSKVSEFVGEEIKVLVYERHRYQQLKSNQSRVLHKTCEKWDPTECEISTTSDW